MSSSVTDDCSSFEDILYLSIWPGLALSVQLVY